MKQPLRLEEQIKHLNQNKNIKFDICKNEEAMNFLLKNNYMDVITPFKYKFHYLDAKELTVGKNFIGKNASQFNSYKENGKHIYPNIVDFIEYKNLFLQEREICLRLLVEIVEFERVLKSVVSYNLLIIGNKGGKFTTEEDLQMYFNKIKMDIRQENLVIRGKSPKKMIETINELMKSISKYGVYGGLDDMSFNTIQTVFVTCDNDVKKEVVQCMKNFTLDLGVSKVQDFEYKLFTLIGIRNVVVHGNSLEIHLR